MPNNLIVLHCLAVTAFLIVYVPFYMIERRKQYKITQLQGILIEAVKEFQKEGALAKKNDFVEEAKEEVDHQ